MLDDRSMFRGNIDDPWSQINKKKIDGIEKKLVLSIMKKSSGWNSRIEKINDR